MWTVSWRSATAMQALSCHGPGCSEVMRLRPADCLLIGDRLETDIRIGRESGMKAALVLTGVTDVKTLESSPIRPDYVLQSIADLESLL